MNTSELLDEIEQLARFEGFQVPDRFQLLKWMSSELNELTSRIEADIFYCHLDPIIQTTAGKRNYQLPANFPANFVEFSGQRFYRPLLWGTARYCVKLDDGSNENQLDYESPAVFYSRNLRGESNNKPTVYTIISRLDGGREISLAPPPDGSYGIDGLYLPTDWKLDKTISLPPLPMNCLILKYAVLRRMRPDFYEMKYQESLGDLRLVLARARPTQIMPQLGRSGLNEYTVARRT